MKPNVEKLHSWLVKKFNFDVEVIIFHELTDVKAPIPNIKNFKQLFPD